MIHRVIGYVILSALASLATHVAESRLIADRRAGTEHLPVLNEMLRDAAKAGDSAAIRGLLDKGADANSASEYGVTALSDASHRGHLGAVRTLLDAGADPGVRDHFYQSTPLGRAFQGGHDEVVAELIERSPQCASEALVIGTSIGSLKIVRDVLEKYHLEPKDFANMVTFARDRGHGQIVRLIQNRSGQMPPPRELNGFGRRVPEPRVPTHEVNIQKLRIRPVSIRSNDVGETTMNWPSFRGSAASGIANGRAVPSQWNVETGWNVRWKVSVAGLGHSSPIVWGEHVFLTTAVREGDEAVLLTGRTGSVESLSDTSVHCWKVVCLDKHNGRTRWEITAREKVPEVRRHPKSSHANPTLATDGKHLVASFGSEGLYCFDFEGRCIWQKSLGTLDSGWFYDSDSQWGFGSSPVIHGNLVIVQCDIQKNSFIAAYDIESGREIWRTVRDEPPSWCTPTVYESKLGPIIATVGSHYARGYAADTGEEMWRLAWDSEISIPTPVVAAGLVYITSGYQPTQPIVAIRTDARGELSADPDSSDKGVVWSRPRGGPYISTPIVCEGFLYICDHDGILTCYNAENGERLYRKRLSGGAKNFLASPIAADGRIYLTSEEGVVLVVQAGPTYCLIATNPVGEYCFATPAISNGMILLRTQHHVVAIEDGSSFASTSGGYDSTIE